MAASSRRPDPIMAEIAEASAQMLLKCAASTLQPAKVPPSDDTATAATWKPE